MAMIRKFRGKRNKDDILGPFANVIVDNVIKQQKGIFRQLFDNFSNQEKTLYLVPDKKMCALR